MGGMGMVNFVFGQLATGHWLLATGQISLEFLILFWPETS
jgi:hypothetical protein